MKVDQESDKEKPLSELLLDSLQPQLTPEWCHPLAQYEKEVKSYAGRSLKDDGIGVRPLVK